MRRSSQCHHGAVLRVPPHGTISHRHSACDLHRHHQSNRTKQMLKRSRDLPPNIEGLEASGRVPKSDYEQQYEAQIRFGTARARSNFSRLLPESSVIVAEIERPLRVADFDALALIADAWIEAHGVLGGLVVHARRFPGWE